MTVPVTLSLALTFILQHQMVLSTAVISQSSCKNGEVRLADGNTKREGRVEVCIDGVWSSVCGKDWDDREARTICRQLKFPNHEAISFSRSRYGKGEKLDMSVKFICEGDESSLLECRYKTFSELDDKSCGGEAAGVQCSHSAAKYTNCEEIFRANPGSSPGYYDIKKDCSDETVYCSFEYGIHCGPGDWYPLVVLDMNNMNVPCPEGFDIFLEQTVRGCVIPFSRAPGCASVKFDTNGITYTKLCGRAIGYQDASIDAFGHIVSPNEDSIDSNYVDGVSITRGANPRQHIWTYAATWNDVNLCPCEDEFVYQRAPSYVKDDYYCESGNPTTALTGLLYPDDPLWDGCQCAENSKCCNSPDMPWFFKTFDTASDDAIEVRLCQDEDGNNERAVLNVLELYIQ